MRQYTIAVVVGSLRKDSFNRKLATALGRLAPAEFVFKQVEIGDLPLYNQDDDANPAASVVRLKQAIKSADGLLFVTPEYNRSIPGVLKNAIDHASRPYGQSVWNGKPGAVISVSPGAVGGFGANHHLRQSLAFLNVATLQQPEAYIGGAFSLFDEKGELVSAGTSDFLRAFGRAFSAWIAKILGDTAPAQAA